MPQPGVTITLPVAGSYTIAFSGACTVVSPIAFSGACTVVSPFALVRHPRPDNAQELTPELIESAALLLERVGVYKGDLWRGARADFAGSAGGASYVEGQPVCAWGAVLVAAGIRCLDARVSIDDLLWDEFSVLSHIAMINDAPQRGCREVVGELRRRAKLLRELQAA